ncbi:MAG: Holliday junction resolvase RuvX [Acidobacteria bacterium]|nr:MAG: Holliday junction resolvase RuvX [Acidobacteriota bacterium]
MLFDRKRRENLSRKFSNSECREELRARGRVLALDIGSKRVGVAISDELRLTARPLPALRRTPWKRLVKDLAELCTEFDVRVVVLGLPLRLDGSEGDAALETRRVARNLGISLKLPIALQDERLTSKAAEASLRNEGLHGKVFADCVDSESAAIFLSDYLALPNEELERGLGGEDLL